MPPPPPPVPSPPSPPPPLPPLLLSGTVLGAHSTCRVTSYLETHARKSTALERVCLVPRVAETVLSSPTLVFLLVLLLPLGLYACLTSLGAHVVEPLRDLVREQRGKRPKRKGYSRTGIIEAADDLEEGEEGEEEGDDDFENDIGIIDARGKALDKALRTAARGDGTTAGLD
eukprot:3404216-Prymnesium_polylepis.2